MTVSTEGLRRILTIIRGPTSNPWPKIKIITEYNLVGAHVRVSGWFVRSIGKTVWFRDRPASGVVSILG